VRQEWLQSSLIDFNQKKAEELARIDAVEREYWSAWQESKRERQTTSTEQITDASGNKVKAGIRKIEQTGDRRYLAGVERCIEQRVKILGLNAPTETRLTGMHGGPISFSLEQVVAAEQEFEVWQRDRLHSNGRLLLLPGDHQVP
jgi:hypothetical protein